MAAISVKPPGWGEIPKAQRAAYEAQWALLGQTLDEFKKWKEVKEGLTKGTDEYKRAARKVNNYPRWIADILQAPPETFLGVDLSRGKAGPDVHDIARRIMKHSTSTGGTMHHITAILQTQAAFKGLNVGGLANLNERLKDLGIALGTTDANLVEVPSTADELHKRKHGLTATNNTDWANKSWRVEDTKSWDSIADRVKAIQASASKSMGAHVLSETSDYAKQYRNNQAQYLTEIFGEDFGRLYKAGLVAPDQRITEVQNLGHGVNRQLGLNNMGEAIDPKATAQIVQEVKSGNPITRQGKKILKLVNENKKGLLIGGAAGSMLIPSLVKAAPVAGTAYEAATHDETQKAHDLKIAQNPNDMGQKAQKWADWFGGKTAQTSLAGMGMTAAGAKLMMNPKTFDTGFVTTAAGLGVTGVSETLNLGAGLTSLSIQGARGVGNWWENQKKKAEQTRQEQKTASQLSVGFPEGGGM